jgi:putative ABC transport system permease protein
MRRHAGYTAINVVGLAVGITVCLLITLYIRHELSYDDFHDGADRIVRVVSDWGDFSVPATNPPMVRVLETEWPDVPIATLLRVDGLVSRGAERFEEDAIFFADPDFFDVFSFALVHGSAETTLERPFTAVVTSEIAQKYFGDDDPIGQTLRLENQVEVEVTGLIEPAPETSHFHYDLLLSWATADAVFGFNYSRDWGRNALYTYMKVPAARSIPALEDQLPELIERHAGSDWNGAALSLQPITRVHLHSHHNQELEANSRAAYVWIFGLIAVCVLVLAGVNFVNLATARAVERAREVGVRKAVGAGRGQLTRQFLLEAVVLAGAALILTIGLVAFALPLFRTLTGTTVEFSVLTDPFTLAALVGITLVAALGAGSYPAFVLSRFDPSQVLRGRSRSGGHGATLRKGLIVVQFAAAVCLIAGTGAAFSQLAYLRAADLGFDQSQVLAVEAPGNPTQGDPQQPFAAFKQELLRQPAIERVTIASERFPSELVNGAAMHVAGGSMDSVQSMRMVDVGAHFFETIGVEPMAGRTFRDDSDSSWAFVVNRAAYELLARQLDDPPAGPEALIGREVMSGWRGGQRGPLIGVVENFHFSTLHESIEPIVFYQEGRNLDTYLVRIQPGAVDAALAAVEATWQRVFPDWPFQYAFADGAFDRAYRTEQRLGQLFGVFAGLAMLIAGLGLFGLAAYTAQQRMREIGIRKAVGATVTQIVALLSKDFAALVLIAIAVAVPVAYIGLEQWLQTFAYRIDLGVGLFAAAGGAALLVALLTVSVQALRAARTDPAYVLRSE